MFKYKVKLNRSALSLVVSLTLFLCVEGRGGPLPPPMEVGLDLAEHVVVGKITSIEGSALAPAGGLQNGIATITVTKTLKGPAKDQIETKVVVGVGSSYSGSWAPKTRRIGDSGVWILGNPSGAYGLVDQSKLKDVEQALDFLAKRKWTEQKDGLEAWAGIFYPQYETDPHPWLSLAIRNVSDHDIYCPQNAVTGTAVAESGEVFSLNPYQDGYLIFCQKLAPGKTMYIANGSFSRYFPAATQGVYKVILKYENLRDGEADDKPGKRVPVKAWTGGLTPLHIKVSVDSKTKETQPNKPDTSNAK